MTGSLTLRLRKCASPCRDSHRVRPCSCTSRARASRWCTARGRSVSATNTLRRGRRDSPSTVTTVGGAVGVVLGAAGVGLASLARLRVVLVEAEAAGVGGAPFAPALGTVARGYQPSSLVHFTTLMFTYRAGGSAVRVSPTRERARVPSGMPAVFKKEQANRKRLPEQPDTCDQPSLPLPRSRYISHRRQELRKET